MARTQKSPVYALADVIRLTGAKRPQIEYWVRKGILRGEFEMGGTGLPRQFVFRNLVESAIALDLNALGAGTEVMSEVLDALRVGDIESDVRTPWFAAMVPRRAAAAPPPPPLSPAERRELKARMKALDETPREQRCCAELNDDGTLKLLKLLRAYVDAGASDTTQMKGLLAVAREHLRQQKQWQREYETLHRRWRLFKNPATRPRNTNFWVVCQTLRPLDDGERWWRTATLTDDSSLEVHGRSVLTVTIRPILEDLEAATDDSWRVTPDKELIRPPREPKVTARQLVAQALQQYEITAGRKQKNARDAKQPEPSVPEDQNDAETT